MAPDLLTKVDRLEKAIRSCKSSNSSCKDCPYEEPYEDCRGELLAETPCMDDFTDDVMSVFLPLLSEYRRMQEICKAPRKLPILIELPITLDICNYMVLFRRSDGSVDFAIFENSQKREAEDFFSKKLNGVCDGY